MPTMPTTATPRPSIFDVLKQDHPDVSEVSVRPAGPRTPRRPPAMFPPLKLTPGGRVRLTAVILAFLGAGGGLSLYQVTRPAVPETVQTGSVQTVTMETVTMETGTVETAPSTSEWAPPDSVP